MMGEDQAGHSIEEAFSRPCAALPLPSAILPGGVARRLLPLVEAGYFPVSSQQIHGFFEKKLFKARLSCYNMPVAQLR